MALQEDLATTNLYRRATRAEYERDECLDAIEMAREWLERFSDSDCIDGHYIPNDAMRLLGVLRRFRP